VGLSCQVWPTEVLARKRGGEELKYLEAEMNRERSSTREGSKASKAAGRKTIVEEGSWASGVLGKSVREEEHGCRV
jgi:hypothetical protein